MEFKIMLPYLVIDYLFVHVVRRKTDNKRSELYRAQFNPGFFALNYCPKLYLLPSE